MFLNPVLNQMKTVEPPKQRPSRSSRKERSDKIKDVKIPLSAVSWGFLRQYKNKLALQDPDICLTDSNTHLLITAILDAEKSPDLIPEVVYDAKLEFVTCKPTVYYREKMDALCILWNTRSVRKVAHRLMSYAIAKEGGPGAETLDSRKNKSDDSSGPVIKIYS
ncbi:hypothetical protein ACFQ88_22530 [Paenibacillus sp. NPDC056579]|uniref:hypothetical protein n=1 Tax=Paenibacillus sp. NPDC056579 TaxID=3345871 RepID=UPI0036CD9839